jgi:hypothetical protein
MKKFECKECRHAFSTIENTAYIMYRCGSKLVKPIIDIKSGFMNSFHKLYVEAVLNISLLKREMDECLVERNKERFKKISSELNLYTAIVKTCIENPEFFHDRGGNYDKVIPPLSS